ncbi:hypothetical protein LSO58_06970 [Acinetobacter ursingii]|uniref:Helix-turn-helix domain-containing protein n=1 Tax=Acinetobacter ursingii TaxID=108980 RepID=A0AA46PME5_9GAMM|nr:hypothetical protein [Acinetobacter ursingii]UYF76610.1 hypothetical protein LSO58_06970 [Acinetobacter ursingii]
MILWVIADIADDNGDTSWYAPRARLIEETGFGKTTISSCIAYLKECGVLQVVGGNGRQNQYVVTAQNFNPDIKYVPKKDTKPDREANQTESQTRPLGEPDQTARRTTPVHLAKKPDREADTIPHSIIYPSVYPSLGDSENPPPDQPKSKPKRITKKQEGINRLVELGCEEKYAHDWMVARKGAQLTDSILENLSEQARKANITIAQAVEWSAKKGYQGFKADWYLKDQNRDNAPLNTQSKSNNLNANYWAKFAQYEQPREPDHWFDESIDVTPKKTNWIEGVGHA